MQCVNPARIVLIKEINLNKIRGGAKGPWGLWPGGLSNEMFIVQPIQSWLVANIEQTFKNVN